MAEYAFLLITFQDANWVDLKEILMGQSSPAIPTGVQLDGQASLPYSRETSDESKQLDDQNADPSKQSADQSKQSTDQSKHSAKDQVVDMLSQELSSNLSLGGLVSPSIMATGADQTTFAAKRTARQAENDSGKIYVPR